MHDHTHIDLDYKIDTKMFDNYDTRDDCRSRKHIIEVFAHFEELYVRKDGESLTIEEWSERLKSGLPRWSLEFDVKGYIIGFEDLSVS